jgi:hypothetical protein
MKRNIGPKTLVLMRLRKDRVSQVWLMGITKRILTRFESVTTLVSRSLSLAVTVATLCAVSVSPALAKDLFYTTSFSSGSAELFVIEVSGSKMTTTDIGPTKGAACASLALSPSGTLFSMCGDLFGTQQLATIDTKTGLASLFGVPVSGLAVMAMHSQALRWVCAKGPMHQRSVSLSCHPRG